ncbi:MAG: hypothetical protein Tsb0017_01450 [Geothermobacteraceae bacterium]
MAVLLTACHPTGAEKQTVNTFTFDGRVVHVRIEGGFFGLIDRQGNRYLPDRLPAAMRRHNLPVRVRAKLLPPAPSYRMWGRRIQLEEIRLR